MQNSARQSLPLPVLTGSCAGADYLTDEALFSACGVRICFNGRHAPISVSSANNCIPCNAESDFNLSLHLDTAGEDVARNQSLFVSALCGERNFPLINPLQVHKTAILTCNSAQNCALEDIRAQAEQGCDAVIVNCTEVGALLNFADCVPVIIVAPTGSFAVVHAGWRGALAGIVGKTLDALCAQGIDPLQCNIYVGPHIGFTCFTVSEEVGAQFVCASYEDSFREGRVDLSRVVALDASCHGADPARICDCGICTACNTDRYFSYRAEDGHCGRQAAFAIRLPQQDFTYVAKNYQALCAEVAAYAAQCGRDPRDVHVLAVSKTSTAEGIAAALYAGADDFGENRPERLVIMQEQFPDASWHFIGNIQSRAIPHIVAHATLIHSVCSLAHAKKIDEAAAKLGKIQPILLEVNVSGEESKSGVSPEEAPGLVAALSAFPHVSVRGLMTMAPQGDVLVAKETFAGLRSLFFAIQAGLPAERAAQFTELSMGMSEDWREAIEEGSTIIRLGRAIFSDSFANI